MSFIQEHHNNFCAPLDLKQLARPSSSSVLCADQNEGLVTIHRLRQPLEIIKGALGYSNGTSKEAVGNRLLQIAQKYNGPVSLAQLKRFYAVAKRAQLVGNKDAKQNHLALTAYIDSLKQKLKHQMSIQPAGQTPPKVQNVTILKTDTTQPTTLPVALPENSQTNTQTDANVSTKRIALAASAVLAGALTTAYYYFNSGAQSAAPLSPCFEGNMSCQPESNYTQANGVR